MMTNQNVTWFINDAPIVNSSYIGSFETTEYFKVDLVVVNNYLGIEPAPAISNGLLTLYFKDYEDNNLLKYFKITFDGNYTQTFNVVSNRATVRLPRTLFGDYQNNPDGCTLHMSLSIPNKVNVKTDLKELFIDIS